jgi:hypothetical protein
MYSRLYAAGSTIHVLIFLGTIASGYFYYCYDLTLAETHLDTNVVLLQTNEPESMDIPRERI